MLIVVTALFEGIVHSAYVHDPSDPENPRLEIDALVREGDLDGPLHLSVPLFRVFCPAGTARDAVDSLRRRRKIKYLDGVAHVRFTTWTIGHDAILAADAVPQRPQPEPGDTSDATPRAPVANPSSTSGEKRHLRAVAPPPGEDPPGGGRPAP